MRQYLCKTIILLFFSLNIAQSETTPIPQLINYQGMLTNAEGQPLETKEYKLSISIFNKPTGGEAVWGPQIFDGRYGDGHGAKVPVVRGRFNVILGEKDINGRIITDAFKTKDAYLEIKVENNMPLSPRQQVLSVPFAVNSENAINSKNAEIAKTVQGEKIYVDPNSGNVGIGKTNPAGKLHVNGNIIASEPIDLNHVATKNYVDNNWPDGDYCILKAGGRCPTGFKEGSIVFDTEDNDNKDSISGNIGDSGLSGGISGIIIKVCCKGK